jgi:hypothetical protein
MRRRNSAQKLKLTERDCRTLRTIVSKNHTTTAAQVTAELNIHLGHAVAQAVSRWLPTATTRVRVRAVCGVCVGQSRFSPSTSVSLANHHFTNFFIITITQGWHNRPIGGCSAEWTQLDSIPHYTNF